MAHPSGIAGISYVVRDVEKSLHDWVNVLGAGPFYVFDAYLADQLYRGQPGYINNRLAVGYCGETFIELIQPLDDSPSIYNEILKGRGEGIHHLWKVSEDFDADIAKYRQAGHALLHIGPIPGIGRIAFVDTMVKFGALMKIEELNEETYAGFEKMKRTHQNWDGSEPSRPMTSL